MITVHEADRFGLRSTFEHLVATAEFQILDQNDTVAIRQCMAVGVLDDAGGVRRVRLRLARPLVTAGDAFVALGVFQDVGHLAHWAGRFAHEEKG